MHGIGKRCSWKLLAMPACVCAGQMLMPGAHAATTTVGGTHNPAALFAQVIAAYKSGSQNTAAPNIVCVRAGKYVIPALPGKGSSATWSFTQDNALIDCTIDLTGVTLIFQGIDGANLQFANCRNVTFRGAAVYKQVPSFTQGTIVKKDMLDSFHWYKDVQIDAGYLSDPATLKAMPTVHLFDPKIMDKNGRPQWKAGEGGYSRVAAVLTGWSTHTYALMTVLPTPPTLGQNTATNL